MHKNAALSILLALGLLIGCNRDKYTTAHSGAEPDFVTDIAPFIYQNCSGCHSKGGMAPFSLTNYRQVKNHAGAIHYMVKTRLMPPWIPDTEYSSFIGEIAIDSLTIDKLKWWIELGMPYGKCDTDVVYKPEQEEIAKYDPNWLYLTTNTEFTHPGDGKDHYNIAPILFKNDSDIYINKIQLVHQNKRIMHHAWVGSLPESTNLNTLSADMLNHTNILTGFLPGMTYNFLPPGYTKVIPARSQIGMQIHYAHSTKTEKDMPGILLHTIKGDSLKKVELYIIMEDSLLEDRFYIKANQTRQLHIKHTLPCDMELLCLTPHMHYRGKKFTSFVVNEQNNDTIPLIRVNDWDFNWQNMYYLKKPLLLKKGYVLYISAEFDNTSRNPRNPVIPPVDIQRGDRSMDEMLELLMEVVKLKN